MRKMTMVALAASMMMLCQSVSAATYANWGLEDDDIHFIFPGWGAVNAPGTDPYGTPDFNLFGLNIDWVPAVSVEGVKNEQTGDRYLNSVKFYYSDPYNGAYGLFSLLRPGDLFFDTHDGTTSDYDWDYLVKLSDSTDDVRPAGDYQVWELNDLSYTQGGTAAGSSVYNQASNAEFASGQYLTRQPHPWGIKTSYLSANATVVDTAAFSGWATSTVPVSGVSATVYMTEFFFGALDSGLKITTGGDNFHVGFTVNCANDVVWEGAGMPKEGPVPEPGTALLLGTGLLGLASTMRRRRS